MPLGARVPVVIGGVGALATAWFGAVAARRRPRDTEPVAAGSDAWVAEAPLD